MFRTTRIDIGKWFLFFRKNKRLLLPLLVFLTGFVCGCFLFCNYGQAESVFLSRILVLTAPGGDVQSLLSALYNACFLPVLLLGVLFFCGLSACGVPFIWLVPFFFGLGFGMSESYYYSTGWHGVWIGMLVVLPPTLIKVTALLLAVMESLRMSLCISSLLTRKNTVGGLRCDLRLFLLRFGVFVLLVLAGGIVDTLLRVVVL